MDSNSDVDSGPSSPLGSPNMTPVGSPYLNSVSSFSNSRLPHLTPLSSRDDEYALSSDSDIASVNSGDLMIRSPTRRLRADSGSSPRSSFSKDSTAPAPRTPKSKKGAPGPVSSSRSRSRSKRRMSRNKDELVPAANIFKNLLILEESLRQQVAAQRSLRNKYMLFLTILSALLGISAYNLLFSLQRPSGFIRVTYQFVSLIVMVTLFLYYISGEYHRTIVLPRRFLSSTNKGLRQLNVRLTKIKTPWSEKAIDSIRVAVHLLASLAQAVLAWSGPLQKISIGIQCQHLISAVENRAQPRVGAVEVKLVLNPRMFSTNIRENWEMYRNEFWAREGARRRGEKIGLQAQESDRRELIDRDKRERKERRRSKAAI